MSNTLDNSRLDKGSLRIEIIVDEDVKSPADKDSLQLAATQAAAHRGYSRGEIGIRVTNNAVIHQINQKHLGHDYPTDVISFSYHADKPTVEGELVVSADTACQRAADLGWPEAHELLLYVVHGTLHVTGMDDNDATKRAEMRAAERQIMMQIGIDDIIHFGADKTRPSILERRA